MSSHALPANGKQLFRYLCEQTSIGIAVEDLEGTILLANPALCSMLGYQDDELAGMTCSQFANPEDSQDDWALFQQLRAGAIDHYTLEKRYVTKQGAQVWGRLNVSLLKTEDEASPLVFAFVEDITGRKRAEEALQENEQRLRLAIQAGRMYVFDWDVVTDEIVRSKESVDILNWADPEHDTGRDFHARVHPDDEALYTATEARLTPENPTYQISFRTVRPGGDFTWLEETGRASFDAQGKMVRVIGMVADITQRKLAEVKLRKSEERFRLAAQAGKMYAYEWDPASDLVTRSEAYGNILGFLDPAEQITRQQLAARVHPDDRARFVSSVDSLTPENPTTRISYRVLHPDGSVIWVEKSGRAFFDAQGKLSRTMGMVADITERKHAEQALRESEDKLRLLLDSTAEAIYGIDIEHRCTFCNSACLRILGYKHIDEVVGKDMHKLIHHTRADGAPFPVEECRIREVTRTGDGAHADNEVLWRANGTSFPVEYWSYPQRRGHEVVGAVVAFIDTTERQSAEAALANLSRKLIETQEQERARIGRELHDDIGQRLALVAAELQQMHQDRNIFARVRRRLGELQKKVSEIAADTQALSHQLHSARLQYLGVTAAVRSFCREFGEQQKVKVEFKVNDVPAALSPDISLCLFRVLQEALHNSAKHSGARRFEVRLWGTANEIHLTVSDSGKGFDRVAAKTSQGLGLISMQERLKLVNGTLSIDSQPGSGTKIEARIPVSFGTDSMRAAG